MPVRRRRSSPTGATSTVDAPPAPPITVAFALVKGERPELVVQKLTELGVDRDRAVRRRALGRAVGRTTEAARNVERLRRVAPRGGDAVPAVLAARGGAPSTVRRRGRRASRRRRWPTAAARPPTLDQPTVLVGPEGGWSRRGARRSACRRSASGPTRAAGRDRGDRRPAALLAGLRADLVHVTSGVQIAA